MGRMLHVTLMWPPARACCAFYSLMWHWLGHARGEGRALHLARACATPQHGAATRPMHFLTIYSHYGSQAQPAGQRTALGRKF